MPTSQRSSQRFDPQALVENPKPLLADSKGVPTLLEWRRKHSPTRPNVVLMFIDDLGYGDIGPFGSKINKTPHLDRMAAEGLKFTDFYNASQNCTPSRAALLTGCYAKRVGMDGRVCFPNEPKALNPAEYTMAEMFKDAGYATGCFGKWHLGHRPVICPTTTASMSMKVFHIPMICGRPMIPRQRYGRSSRTGRLRCRGS